jgi:aminopeptidase N
LRRWADALKSSHPVRVEVGHPDEINEIFDAVSYAKGASVLRMLTHHLGGLDVFLKGVRLYLKEHAFKNAASADLWRALEQGAELPAGSVAALMTQWTTVTGYPLLSVGLAPCLGSSREAGSFCEPRRRWMRGARSRSRGT